MKENELPVTEDELREAVSKYWEIDEIRPAFIHANMGAALPADAPFEMPTFEKKYNDDQIASIAEWVA